MATHPADKLKKCPLCGKPADPVFRPFCSRRCADLDLGKWLTGAYAIPTEEEADIPGAEADGLEEPPKPH